MKWLVYPLLVLLAHILASCGEPEEWQEYDANALQRNCELNGYTWNKTTGECVVWTRKN
ncbi:hypothetical protein [Plectonema phage JingP1]|uniref:Lipoprotein n=1 Tax=Plectonema phage JingP1 TaxID=2961687 RepID=A0A9E7T1H5_9CAUD|nr:hypothetical protein [Plectonema phage JingP1]UVD33206.1 hypothetical protein [Plectonema phage Pbo-yong3]